jgi:hypothetical protein
LLLIITHSNSSFISVIIRNPLKPLFYGLEWHI